MISLQTAPPLHEKLLTPYDTADDKNWLTAESSIPDEAKRYWDWAKCASVSIGTAPNDARVSDEDCTLPPELAMAGFTRDSDAVPTTREILLAAATLIHADGAGLHKRPSKVSFTNKYIPTIVAATHPTQTHTINLLGHDITITLKATNYEWDWGDGTPNTVTAYQGMPYEKGMDLNKDPRLIRHYYTPWACAQVVDGLFMRPLSRPLGVARIRWGICRRGWCGCGGGCRSLRSRWRPRCRPGRGW